MTNTTPATLRNVSTAALKTWARANKELAEVTLKATAFAQLERERVAAYIEPMFQSYGFRDEDNGEILTDSRRAYLAGDDSRFPEYYAACDLAHREHGFNGEPGVCPALAAEELQREAEQALLESMGNLTGLDGNGFNRSLELRAKALKWALTVCLAKKIV